MTLMPVSNTSDFVERRASDGGADAPNAIRHRTGRFAIYGIAKYIEHPRENRFAHRRFQRPARILHRRAASETLRGCQRNPAHVTGIALRQHFDDDVLVGTGTQYGIDGRQTPVEPDVHDAAPHRDHHARIRRTRSIVHGCSIRSARRPCPRRIAILPQPRTLGQS